MLAEIYLLKLEAAVRAAKPRLLPRGLCRSPYRLPRRPNPPLVSATTACGHPTVPVDLCPAAYEQASFH